MTQQRKECFLSHLPKGSSILKYKVLLVMLCFDCKPCLHQFITIVEVCSQRIPFAFDDLKPENRKSVSDTIFTQFDHDVLNLRIESVSLIALTKLEINVKQGNVNT